MSHVKQGFGRGDAILKRTKHTYVSVLVSYVLGGPHRVREIIILLLFLLVITRKTFLDKMLTILHTAVTPMKTVCKSLSENAILISYNAMFEKSSRYIPRAKIMWFDTAVIISDGTTASFEANE